MRGVKPNQPCEAELVDDFPEVPDHPPITRRDQFAVKNSLKKDKQDKQEARTKAKATAKPKPRGRPKKQHVEVEDATVESVDLRKQKKADKNKAARKRRQKTKDRTRLGESVLHRNFKRLMRVTIRMAMRRPTKPTSIASLALERQLGRRARQLRTNLLLGALPRTKSPKRRDANARPKSQQSQMKNSKTI